MDIKQMFCECSNDKRITHYLEIKAYLKTKTQLAQDCWGLFRMDQKVRESDVKERRRFRDHLEKMVGLYKSTCDDYNNMDAIVGEFSECYSNSIELMIWYKKRPGKHSKATLSKIQIFMSEVGVVYSTLCRIYNLYN